MTLFKPTTLLGLALRLLLVAVCAIPFANPRRLAAALYIPPPAVALGGQLPSAPSPVSEEDEIERHGDIRAREAAGRSDRRTDRARSGTRSGRDTLPLKQRLSHLSHFGTLRPAAADPFRNGLGTPFRC
jgi:hypothetical protein